MKISFSYAKEIKARLSEIGCDDWREYIEQSESGKADFTIGDYRFIHDDVIDNTMAEELGDDEYLLGSFNAWFLASILDLEEHEIEGIQSKCPEALGKLIKATGKLEELQKDYASADGYGHHFAHYDHEEHELPLGFYGFRVN